MSLKNPFNPNLTLNYPNTKYLVASFYKFVEIYNVKELQQSLKNLCAEKELLGTIILSQEGINSTLCGTAENLESVLSHLKTYTEFSDLDIKFSKAELAPFHKLKVLVKKEIVTLRKPEVKVSEKTGHFVPAEQWNELISNPEVLVIDTRNNYETTVGTFQGAIDPNTESFTQFPDFIKTLPAESKKKKIAMFCTGGIRCEKASSFLLSQGFENVYQLQGGILKYLEKVPAEQSLWQGECFIFDDRLKLEKESICELKK